MPVVPRGKGAPELGGSGGDSALEGRDLLCTAIVTGSNTCVARTVSHSETGR